MVKRRTDSRSPADSQTLRTRVDLLSKPMDAHLQGPVLANIQGEIRKRTALLSQLSTQMTEVIADAIDAEGKATGAYSAARDQWTAAKNAFDEQDKAAKSGCVLARVAAQGAGAARGQDFER